MVMAGHVSVNGKVVSKVGTPVHPSDQIDIKEGPKYVSRGGLKLEGALIDFQLSPQDQICIDIGSSTGGFTDCLLQHGAQKVYALDVGKAQLMDSLRKNPQVVTKEQTHILHVDRSEFKDPLTWATIDVSFISLKKVLPKAKILLQKRSTVVALVKPQFEVGPKNLKKGVVQSEEIREKAVIDCMEFATGHGFQLLNRAPSRLKGPKGNQEYFLHLQT